jgi:RNA polymerase sigma-70 factor (ECF subfamily)
VSNRVYEMIAPLTSPELGELYRRYAPAVYRRALKLLRNEAEAWDAVHQVFERLLANPAAFRREASPMTFLYRMATNLALNRLRAHGSKSEYPVPTRGHDSATAGAEARDLVAVLSARLDERALQIACLHFIDGLTQEQITPIVGLSRKTVGRQLTRIRQLAEDLTQEAEND